MDQLSTGSSKTQWKIQKLYKSFSNEIYSEFLTSIYKAKPANTLSKTPSNLDRWRKKWCLGTLFSFIVKFLISQKLNVIWATEICLLLSVLKLLDVMCICWGKLCWLCKFPVCGTWVGMLQLHFQSIIFFPFFFLRKDWVRKIVERQSC